ncbi:sensor histidine kinase [Spirochaeta thermophila]|uniref:Two-component sensor histidine kinase n=1 Tax=Winmispira thermophila (strain ATCC 49972 / DSM 6192 / RI 19.B1) TaxID=665571 RepID=E0RS03_WINT6|nr:histidine kinase [Spirochaeta thermophila]ADN01790.1 two-component sensor histidine kinase [Spirochaeta thermophila DSM 6192]
MRFQTRLFMGYSLLIVVLVVILTAGFYLYARGLFERNAVETSRLLVSKVGSQLDAMWYWMDFVLLTLLSDASFKSAVTTLHTLPRDDPSNNPFLNDAMWTIRRFLLSYVFHKAFHAVIFLNGQGDLFSSNFMAHSSGLNKGGLPNEIAALLPHELGGSPFFLLPPFQDPWTEDHLEVFGMGRTIWDTGGEKAWLVVLKPIRDLELLIRPSLSPYTSVIIAWRGMPFFSSPSRSPISSTLLTFYSGIVEEKREEFVSNPTTGRRELVLSYESQIAGLRVFWILERDALLRPLRFTSFIAAMMALSVVAISLLFNLLFTRSLTRPLRMLREWMEGTEVKTLTPPSIRRIETSHDEVMELVEAFRDLTYRLDDSIRRELQLRTSWMQTKLDLVYSQVNPHFLYNVLNVISQRAFQVGDDIIPTVCDGIAAMLRYASAQDHMVLLREELEYLRHYLFIMKLRLEDAFEWRVEVEDGLLGVRVPRMILQPLVENAVKYRKRKERLVVRVEGVRGRGASWLVRVSDNGMGMTPEKMEEVRRAFALVALHLDRGEELPSVSAPGGTGLVNLYTRLYVVFRDRLVWRMESNVREGTLVEIGVKEDGGDQGDGDRR